MLVTNNTIHYGQGGSKEVGASLHYLQGLFFSDFCYLNRFFNFLFLSNHPTPPEVNQSSSAQCLRVDNSNNAIKVKQIYIQIKEINEVKS